MVFARVRYSYGLDGSFPSIRAGQTTVLYRERGEAASSPAELGNNVNIWA